MLICMSCHDSDGDEQCDVNKPNTVYFSASCGQNQGTEGGCRARYTSLLLVSLTRSAMQYFQSCLDAHVISSSAANGCVQGEEDARIYLIIVNVYQRRYLPPST